MAVVISGLMLGTVGCGPELKQKHEEQNRTQIKVSEPLYLRGSFNSWGTTAPLKKVSDKQYITQVDLGLGVHSFKIASQDWASQWALDSIKMVEFELSKKLEQPLALTQNSTSKEVRMLVEQPGEYEFTLKWQKGSPVVMLKRIVSEKLAQQAPLGDPEQTQKLIYQSYDKQPLTASFSVTDEQNGLRTYVHQTTQKLRDPVPQFSVYAEDEAFPQVRSGSIAFDALFALAVDEFKLDSVEKIRDSSYNKGQAIDCACFETGEKWHYVWTRDLAYAAHLGLALLDPERVKNSLEFKLSGYREGIDKPKYAAGSMSGLQVIQDTGSGGSWPISTDRVTWAFGADAAINMLSSDSRREFSGQAFEALANTIENDRLATYNAQTGLYGGEQSFLDWREQSYAAWIADDLTSMASSQSLSTNVAHYQAIRLAADLADELKQNELTNKYKNWAKALKQAINERFWLAEKGLYSSLTAGHFDTVAMAKFDWLGQSLAIITGIADKQKAQQILANYPHGPMGAPVIFPQQSGIPVYHNRAIWPFVTAYGLKAAIVGDNYRVADAAYQTLIRSAALNLSNMENLEWLSAQSVWLEKANPELSGPVINSKRQLWSVAAYLNMVVEGIFGVQVNKGKLGVKPYITTELANQFFTDTKNIELSNLTWRGKKITVNIEGPLTKDNKQGVYQLAEIKLNGQQLDNSVIEEGQLTKQNKILIKLMAPAHQVREINLVDSMPGVNDPNVFAPYEPTLSLISTDAGVKITIIDDKNGADVSYQIFRNGEQLIDALPQKSWFDATAPEYQACYSVAAIYNRSGHASHHSPVVCTQQGYVITVENQQVSSNKPIVKTDLGASLKNWGAPEDSLIIKDIEVEQSGKYALQFKYTNHQHDINTGITNGVKWLRVMDNNKQVIHEGVVQLPHTKVANGLAYSTPVEVTLAQGTYVVSLHDFYNMSYLTNNQTYIAAGGTNGPVNQFDLYGLKVMPTGSADTSSHQY